MRNRSDSARQPWVIAAVLITICGTGCFGGGNDGPDLGKVSGTVTIDGNPIEHVEVLFEPESDAAPSRGRTDAEGKFTVYYPPATPGAVPGRHHVQFDLQDADHPVDIIPKNVRIGSPGIAVDVSKDGPNEYQFDLSKK